MNCGECLMNRVEIVPLNSDGKCPTCGTKYESQTRGPQSESQILTYLQTGTHSARDVSMAFGIPYSDAYMTLDSMRNRGLVEYISGRFPEWKVKE